MIDHVIVTDEEATRVITLRRPEKKNALTPNMYAVMRDAIESAQSDPAIRCIMITGGSGVFTAGHDIDDLLQASERRGEHPREALKFLHALIYNAKPIIAAVDGIAVGIGTTMLFHCDYVLASTTATFVTPFIQLGLVPEGASSLLAPMTMGHQRAFAMLVMGHTVSAEQAQVAGLINAVVAPGYTEIEARKVAREICALPAQAVALSRQLLRPPPDELERRVAQESHLFAERLASPEAIAAFRSFFARKKA